MQATTSTSPIERIIAYTGGAMKPLWIVLGVLGGLCLICGIGGYFVFAKGKAAFDEAGTYGDASFKAIATNWDMQEFKSRLAPQVTQQNKPEVLDQTIETF